MGWFNVVRYPKLDSKKKETLVAEKFDFDFSASLPGESIVKAVIDAVAVDRSTMSQANRDKFDDLRFKILSNIHNLWVDLWSKAGIPGEKV